LAASEGAARVVELLVQNGAEVNAKDRWGGTPLRDAVRHGHEKLARYLVSHGGMLGFDEVAASSELCEMARSGSLDIIKLMITCGAPVDAQDYDSRTALHLACAEGNLPIVSYLLRGAGANINALDRWGSTPLADAILHGHAMVTDLLVANQAQLKWDEIKTSSELCELARRSDTHKIALLLKAGCNVDSKDYDARTALHLAASEGAARVVELLVQNGAEVNAKDRWGGTPLRDAVRHGHSKLAQYLVEKGGVLALSPLEAATQLCCHALEGRAEDVNALVEAGADVNAADWDGRTALHVAASAGHRATAQVLIRRGARTDLVDRWGQTAADQVKLAELGAADWFTMLWGSGSKILATPATAQDPGRSQNGSANNELKGGSPPSREPGLEA